MKETCLEKKLRMPKKIHQIRVAPIMPMQNDQMNNVHSFGHNSVKKGPIDPKFISMESLGKLEQLSCRTQTQILDLTKWTC